MIPHGGGNSGWPGLLVENSVHSPASPWLPDLFLSRDPPRLWPAFRERHRGHDPLRPGDRGLKGECFQCCVKVGDKVKAGELLAKADLKALEEKQVNTVTPVLICGGTEGRSMNAFTGPVRREQMRDNGFRPCPRTGPQKLRAPPNPDGAPAANASSLTDTADRKTEKTRKSLINFDFLQKLGKVLMTVIAVMPAAGLMISVGKLIQMAGGDMGAVLTIGSTMETIGWAVINNLHILFAVAIGGSWAKERAGGAFAAVIAFILINVITGALFGVSSADLNNPEAVTRTLLGQESW